MGWFPNQLDHPIDIHCLLSSCPNVAFDQLTAWKAGPLNSTPLATKGPRGRTLKPEGEGSTESEEATTSRVGVEEEGSAVTKVERRKGREARERKERILL